MTSVIPHIIYLHGFNSSPASYKAQALLKHKGLVAANCGVTIPELPYDPHKAIELVEELITTINKTKVILVGSSLGGYLATYLSEKFQFLAVLINPAVSPYLNLKKEFLGEQINFYTGEKYQVKNEHLDFLASLEVEVISRPENFLLFVQKGDEVLDYRLATKKYSGAEQIIQEGGNHGFVKFEEILPKIFEFAGIE